MLNVIDEYTRECLRIHVDRRTTPPEARRIMSSLIERKGALDHIRSHNGSEFIESGLGSWLAEKRIKTLCIEPRSPWQNGYVEGFNARFREESLDREQLWTLTEDRVAIEDWRWKYNNIRPHRSLGYVTPLEFAQERPEETESSHIINTSRLTKALAQFG